MRTRALLLVLVCSACRVTCGPVRMPPTAQPSAREPAIDFDRQRAEAQQISPSGNAGNVSVPGAVLAGVAGGALIGVGVAAAIGGGDGGAPPPLPSDQR